MKNLILITIIATFVTSCASIQPTFVQADPVNYDADITLLFDDLIIEHYAGEGTWFDDNKLSDDADLLDVLADEITPARIGNFWDAQIYNTYISLEVSNDVVTVVYVGQDNNWTESVYQMTMEEALFWTVQLITEEIAI